MIRRTALAAVALVAGALLVGLATPAHADQTPRVRCSTSATLFYAELEGIAYYNHVTPTVRSWYRFRYEIDGLLVGDKSNVNIRLYDGNERRWEFKSPDDRRAGVSYMARPLSPVLTGTNDAMVSFEGIFDRARRSDPRCTAYTPPL